MKIDTEITSQIPVNYTFITGKSNINCDYFIDKIEEGIGGKDNKNFQTNVHGYMTPWKYFIRDLEFLNFLYPIFDKIDSLPVKPPRYYLDEAWGIKETLGHRSSIHNHQPAYLSGVLYLNNHSQILDFPEINKFVKPKEGGFVLFSSFLKHGAKRNLTEESKYAISFNLHYQVYNQ
jgi:hypothetical protein|tara:strand:+ start:176 stop:703 length:528 start_codon:yes stop_codon:yes gene_type:complete